MKKKIICIGNRFLSPDNSAIELYEILKGMECRAEVIDGGLGGLNLMEHFEEEAKVLVIDYLPGVAALLTDMCSHLKELHVTLYDHATAFFYLMQTLCQESQSVDIQLLGCDKTQPKFLESSLALIREWEGS